METFKHFVVLIVVGGGGIVAICLAIMIFYFMVQRLWPLAVGVLGGYLTWEYIDNDLGIAFGVVCALVQLWWWQYSKEDLSIIMQDPPADKNKKLGEFRNLPGYFDM